MMKHSSQSDGIIYRAVQPRSTHFRAGRCEEARCPKHLKGWETIVPEGPLAQQIRGMRHMAFKEERQPGGLVAFTFAPGQQCFLGQAGGHHVFIERPAFAMIGGPEVLALDPTNPAHVAGMQRRNWIGGDWVDHNREHLDKLKRLQERG